MVGFQFFLKKQRNWHVSVEEFGLKKFLVLRCTDEEMEAYGIHLLALSHVYLVPQLKQRCTKGLADRLTNDNVVDVLQLARLCDAPDLYIKCMRLISDHFKTVEKTEGWKFLQDHDPHLELEILQFMEESESVSRQNRVLFLSLRLGNA